MSAYREVAPPASLAATVECFWIMPPDPAPAAMHRVTPDGCADIIFYRASGSATLEIVGAMTRFDDFPREPQTTTIGMRFRPGQWARLIGVPAEELRDRVLPLEDLWGARARRLSDQLASAPTLELILDLLAAGVEPAAPRNPVQRAIEWMERERGMISLDELADQAFLSVRQFRRGCIRETGLSPKLLARILRFRHALARLRREAGEHAGLAADCGYADQSHMISDFHEFAGRTPSEFVRSAGYPQPGDIPNHRF